MRLIFRFFIRYYAQNDFQSRVAQIHRISKPECAIIIEQVSDAILTECKDEFMQQTTENWIKVANEFDQRWQLPNCLGAVDGKHIAITKPHNAGSDYFNFKRFHSIILMACVDANLKFISIDVGGKGAEGDASMFNRIEIGRMIRNNDQALNLPPNSPIGHDSLPHFFIGDDAFPLLPRMMKPFKPKRNERLIEEQEIFNYRISRARFCVESAFGVLSKKWQVINGTFHCQPNKVKKIVAACCVLHNMLLNRTPQTYIDDDIRDQMNDEDYEIAQWRRRLSQNINPLLDAREIRESLKDFFNSPQGSLPFQRIVV